MFLNVIRPTIRNTIMFLSKDVLSIPNENTENQFIKSKLLIIVYLRANSINNVMTNYTNPSKNMQILRIYNGGKMGYTTLFSLNRLRTHTDKHSVF